MPLRHKFFWQEDKATKEFIFNFSGVMSQSERDELIKAAPESDHIKFRDAIEQLYKESQELQLRSNDITLFSYVPKIYGTGINEIELQLTNLFKGGYVKYHPTQDVAFVKI